MKFEFTHKRVALYIRVSTEEQVLHGYSLEAQKQTLIDFARQNEMKIIDCYIDEGVSARKKYTTRKEFMRMLEDVKLNKIDVILFIKLDRWFRSVSDYYKVQEILEKHNVTWKAVLEEYDTATANGRLHINIKLSIAQDESDRTSERIKYVFENKIKNGEVITGNVPLGYKIENKKLVIDNDKVDIVRSIFDKFSITHAIRTTGKYVESHFGLNLCDASIRNILKNSIYIGKYKNVDDYCPAIIDKALFEDVQINLKRSVRSEPNYIYIFTSLVFCGLCNHSATGYGAISSNGKKYRYYGCEHKRARRLCKGIVISEIFLERYLVENIAILLKQALDVNTKNNIPSSKKTIDKSLIRRKLTKLKDLYLNDLITLEEYKIDHEKYTNLLNSDNDSNKKANNDNILSSIDFFSDGNWTKIYNTFSNHDKRIFWRKFISKIVVDDKKNITVEFI